MEAADNSESDPWRARVSCAGSFGASVASSLFRLGSIYDDQAALLHENERLKTENKLLRESFDPSFTSQGHTAENTDSAQLQTRLDALQQERQVLHGVLELNQHSDNAEPSEAHGKLQQALIGILELNENLQELRGKMDELEREADALRRENGCLKSTEALYQSEHERAQVLENECEKLRHAEATLRSEHERLETAHATLQISHELAMRNENEKFKSTEALHQDAQGRVQSLEKECKQLRDAADSLRCENKQLESLRTACRISQERIDALEKECKQASREANGLRNENERLKPAEELYRNAQEQVQRLESECKQSRKVADALRSENEKLNSSDVQCRKLRDEVNVLHHENERLKSTESLYQKTQEDAKRVEKECKQLRKFGDTLRNQNEKLKSVDDQYQQLCTEAGVLRNENERLKTANALFKGVQDKFQIECQQLREEVDALRNENARVTVAASLGQNCQKCAELEKEITFLRVPQSLCFWQELSKATEQIGGIPSQTGASGVDAKAPSGGISLDAILGQMRGETALEPAPRQPWAVPWSPSSAAAPLVSPDKVPAPSFGVIPSDQRPSSLKGPVPPLSSCAMPSDQRPPSLKGPAPSPEHFRERGASSGCNDSDMDYNREMLIKDAMKDLLNPNPAGPRSLTPLANSSGVGRISGRNSPRNNLGLMPSASLPSLSANPNGSMNPFLSQNHAKTLHPNDPGVESRLGNSGLDGIPPRPPRVPKALGASASSAAALGTSPNSANASRRPVPETPTLSQELQVQDMLRGLTKVMSGTKAAAVDSVSAPSRCIGGRGPSKGPQPPNEPFRVRPPR